MKFTVHAVWKLLPLILVAAFVLLYPYFDSRDTVEAKRKKHYRRSFDHIIKNTRPEVSKNARHEAPKPAVSAPTPPAVPTLELTDQFITFYGFNDNDPAGRAIAYPNTRNSTTIHRQAGGIGTYNDPITFASDPTEWPIGTRVYLPYLQKYFIMEDYCAGCVENWSSGRNHIDLWMESNGNFSSELIKCQYSWTRATEVTEINPPPGRTVNPAPLFDSTNGSCLTNTY
jgi:3D (Asp-Asp-Asp) domain-containing protein